MLEKIGLPPKPSLRGNNWVVDSSHCQGCSSQFTFINRKHHCRRCGGLFCNSCTQQRMVLRGQGDSPVRICDPCKKLEEAARFEMRYGHKNRAGRGGSKLTAKSEDEILNQILGNEGESSMSSRSVSAMDMLSSAQNPRSSASCSNIQDISSQDDRDGTQRSISRDQPPDISTVMGDVTPEELRQQAVEEKKKYRTLKAEGKPEEALRAFKRGKELEKQAGALEINLRKRRKKALSFSNNSEVSSIKDDDAKASLSDNKLLPQRSKEKDDLAAELRELGWSDMDLRDADKKPATMSLEGELSTILGEVSQRANTEKRTHGIDKSQVIVHKRKALELKRQGNLAEAKEELKRAKVLEKQIEEQELLGEDEDSDEEFSSLLRSVNVDKNDDSSIGYNLDHGFDFGQLGGMGDDRFEGILEVTEDDMDDPEMAAALKSLGWTETTHPGELDSHFAPAHSEALLNEIQSLKKEALKQKRAGNSGEALGLFRKAKLLEKELKNSNSQETNLMMQSSVSFQGVSHSQSVEEPVELIDADVRNVNEKKGLGSNIARKSKSTIQKELLGLKKRALALRREGKLDEAEEELKKGKVLEKQLEEMENAPGVTHMGFSNKNAGDIMITNDGDEGEVTDQDMNDPSYLSLLQTLGWKDDDNENRPSFSPKKDDAAAAAAHNNKFSEIQPTTGFQYDVSRKSKSEIQRELLGLKRKSLALRRQGEAEEAEEVLKMAEVLEAQLAEFEAPMEKDIPAESVVHRENTFHDPSPEIDNQPIQLDSKESPLIDLGGSGSVTVENPKEMNGANETPNIPELNSAQANVSQNNESSIKLDILAHKRKALALKREGKLEEAKEELRQAKLLEKHVEEIKSQPSTSSDDLSGTDISSVGKKDSSHQSGPKPLSSRDRFKLQQESLNHKRQALKLRREGRTEEADAEFELAKALESQLEEVAAHDPAKSSENAAEPADEVIVEDFLDPQLLSALKAIGLDDVSSGSQGPEKHESKKPVAEIDNSNDERMQLEERIKAEKVKALNFKRSGKQTEALDALRTAKLLEKKLNSLTAK
ncbi:hypothetical protein ACH5RR_014939 [Cinchona calisaya]|uniref:FYVE-type domain-containing protein n=1 Tax=Cinchona calisaya TaxID=153742 RepID=A0ABD2ZV82_9GENT